jgi:hypothetical protein
VYGDQPGMVVSKSLRPRIAGVSLLFPFVPRIEFHPDHEDHKDQHKNAIIEKLVVVGDQEASHRMGDVFRVGIIVKHDRQKTYPKNIQEEDNDNAERDENRFSFNGTGKSNNKGNVCPNQTNPKTGHADIDRCPTIDTKEKYIVEVKCRRKFYERVISEQYEKIAGSIGQYLRKDIDRLRISDHQSQSMVMTGNKFHRSAGDDEKKKNG